MKTKDMMECPLCGCGRHTLRELAAHLWFTHLQPERQDRTEEYRLCWCGERFYGLTLLGFRQHLEEQGGAAAHFLAWKLRADPGRQP